jgi:hypothetical protein
MGVGQILGRLQHENTPYLLALLCISLLSIALRLAFLSQPMRFDEAFTFLRFASKPLSEGLTQYSEPNNHLFHTLLVHVAYSLFGDLPWVIRLPALLAGIALVPLVYYATRQHYNPEAGLLAAAFAGSSSVLIEFSTNARGYMLVCCFFMALLGLAHHLRCLSDRPRWGVFALFTALGMYTIPTMFYPLEIVSAWLLLSILVENTRQPRRVLLASFLLALLLAACLTLVIYLPVIEASGLDSLTGNRYVQALPWQNFVLQIPILLERLWLIWNRDVPVPVQWMLVIGFVTSVIFHRRLARHPIPIVLAAALSLIPTLVVQRVIGFPRTWLFLLPLYFMLASAGIIYLVQVCCQRLEAPRPVFLRTLLKEAQQHVRTLYAALALVVSLALGLSVLQNQSILMSDETGALRGAESFTLLLKDRLQPGDAVLALRPADAPLEYYFRRNGLYAGYLNSELANKTRLFVVVYEPASTLADTLARAGLSSADYGVPELVARIEPASLFAMERLRAPAQKRLPIYPQHLVGNCNP